MDIILFFVISAFYILFLILFLINFWKRNKVGCFIITLLTASIVYFIFLYFFLLSHLFFMHSLPYEKESFTTQKWKSDEDHRYEIVDDLINSNLVNGKSRNQVIEILGEPCDYNEDGGYIEYLYKNDTLTRDSDFVYSIGTKPGIYQGVGFFLIWFKNDTVVRYKIH